MATTSLPSSLDQLLQSSDRPILVDFWAEWCGPCRAMSPTLQEIAREFRGKLYVVKVNVDEKPRIAAQYRISGIPTLILFSGNEVLWRSSGALPFQRLKSELEQHLPA
jgi:thioredoxin 1